MNARIYSVLVLIWLCHFREAVAINRSIAISRGLLIFRTISITQRSCNCPLSFSCSCCQDVIILYTKKQKALCMNFTYQRNGLNVDVTLGTDTINIRTITNYKAFEFCVLVPGCLFSSACINILELTRYSSSITICSRMDIYAKKKLWQINYDCISVSTELPTVSASPMTRMTFLPSVGSSISASTMQTQLTQMMTMGMSEINTAGTAGMTEETTSTITEMMRMNSEQIEQMTID